MAFTIRCCSSSQSFFSSSSSKIRPFPSNPGPIPPRNDLRPAMSSAATPSPPRAAPVPGLAADEVAAAAEAAFARHSSPDLKRSGRGVAVMWFRNDLRLLDNEPLVRAWAASECLLPVYCLDPRHFGTTHYFGFPKTGAIRAQFLIECLEDLKKNMMKRGLNLLVQYGKPETILPQIVKTLNAHTVYAQRETCSEELLVERLVRKGLQEVVLPRGGSSNQRPVSPKLVLVWGSTMYHIDDLPFTANNLPDVYTQFRRAVESKSTVRSCFKSPPSLGPPPEDSLLDQIGGWGTVPTLEQLGLKETKCGQGMHFHGGENAALGRIFEYFWKKDQLKVYKETRNGMLGPDYSTKFSPWLASGSMSPRYIHEEVRRYEKQRLANESTYW